MRKKLFNAILIFMLFTINSCKKDNGNNKLDYYSSIKPVAFTKTTANQELSTKDISDIENLYPGLKISIQKNNYSKSTESINKENTLKFIDSIRTKLETSFPNTINTLKFDRNISNNARNPWWWEGGEDIPDDGGGTITYTAVVASGGLFSSFNLTFGYGSGGISSSSLSLQGMTVGWWWNSGYSYNSGNSGYIQGTATYFYGVVTLNLNYTLHYTFSPIDGTITYNWTNP